MAYIVSFISLILLAKSEFTCLQDLERIATTSSSELVKMMYYSGHDVNDLGQFHECNELPDARYVLLMVKIDILVVNLGICGPKSCKASDYQSNLRALVQAYPQASKLINSDKLVVEDPAEYNSRSLSIPAIFTVIFFVLLLGLVIAGSLITHIAQSNAKHLKGWKSYVMCFSLPVNFQRMTTLPEKYDHMQLFNGIRVLGMLMISVGHTYMYYLMFPMVNPLKGKEIVTDFWHYLIFYALYTVDVFFLMAGFLLAYLTLSELNKKRGNISWGMFVVHRIMRICPIYFVMLAIYVNIFPYIGSGPAWPVIGYRYNEICEDYWWTNLVFINNFYPSGYVLCMSWSWFITNDMQFYLLSPFVLIIHYKSKLYGYCALFLLLLTNIIITVVVSIDNDFNPGMLYGMSNNYQFTHAYIRPYFRMGAYLMGMMFGFLYRGYVDSKDKGEPGKSKEIEMGSAGSVGLIQENTVKKGKITRIEIVMISWARVKGFRVAAFVIGVVGMISILYAPYNFENNGKDYWSKGEKITFMASEHILFSISLILCLIPMVEGYGGWALKFLTFKYFAVVAKISFSFYLVHPLFVHYYLYNRHQALYLHDLIILYPWFSTVILSLIAATLFTLTIESPVLALERKIFSH